MKELHELTLPEDLKYSQEHEWAKSSEDAVRVGTSDFAQDQLGDIVFVELREEGTRLDKGEEFSTLESVKAVSEVYMPVGGTIKAVNTQLEEKPELVNQDPYGQGWLVEITPGNIQELDDLMDKNGYLEMLKGES